MSDLLSAPFVWIGTVAEIRDRLRDHRTRLGLDRYVVRAGAIPQVREILTGIDQTAY